ncbi:M48 family metalloprotease [Caulobacter segnis]
MKRAVAVLVVSALALASPAVAAESLKDRMKKMVPTKGFSVDGKRGKFLDQIKDRDFTPPPPTAGALGFGALDKGDLQKARLRMPQTEAAVAQMLAKLDGGWRYAKFGELKVYVIGSGGYQALARPDYSMTVTVGMLALADSDDEVAFMFAHELSHIRMNHFARDQSMAKMRQVATQVNSIYTDSVRLSQMRVRTVGDNTQLYTENQKKVDAAGLRAAANKQRMDLLLTTLVDTPWSRKDEDEADAGGYDLAETQTYSSAIGAPAAFGRMKADFDLKAALGEAMQSQLTTSLAVLGGEAGQILQNGGGQLSLQDQFKQAKVNLFASGRQAAINYFQQRHRSPEDRQKGIAAYSQAVYQPRLPIAKTEWLTATRGTKEFKDAALIVRAVQDSQDARGKGEFAAAVAAMAPALKTSFGTVPFVANEAAQAFDSAGDSVNAEKQFMIAHKHPDQTVDGYQAHLDMLLRLRRYARVLEVAKAASLRYGDERPFLPDLVAASLRTGKKDETAVYLQKCMATENESLKDQCIHALTDPAFQKQYDALPPHSRALVDAQLQKTTAQASVSPSTGLLGTLGSMLKAADAAN